MEEITQPIIGHRGWIFDESNNKLRSFFKQDYWHYNQPLWAPLEPRRNWPDGIHAFKKDYLFESNYGGNFSYRFEIPHLSEKEANIFPIIRGEVYLWGKIVECEDGYRAEYAYPKKLYISDDIRGAKKIAKSLSQNYGCEVEIVDISKNSKKWEVPIDETFIVNSIKCYAIKFPDSHFIYSVNPFQIICQVLNKRNKYEALKAFKRNEKKYKKSLEGFSEFQNFTKAEELISNIKLEWNSFYWKYFKI